MKGREESTTHLSMPAALSADARKLYLSVLQNQGHLATRAASSDLAGLSELLNIGLLVPDPEDPEALIAVDPKQLSEQLSSTWQRQALDLLNRAVTIPADLHDLAEAFHLPEQPGGTIEYMRGRVLINQRLQQLAAACTDEILAAQPGGPRPPHALAAGLGRDLETIERGISSRTIYHPSTRYHAPTRDYVAAISQAGGQVRTLDEPFGRLIVMDRRIAIIPLKDDPSQAVFVRDAGIVTYLAEEVFEHSWNRGLDFVGGRSVPQQVVSRLRQTIIDLLLKGTSHRVIARSLGISERTLARHLAEMREDYHVDSLFQLGYVLAQSAPRSPDFSDDLRFGDT